MVVALMRTNLTQEVAGGIFGCSQAASRFLVIILVVLSVLAIVAGIIYYAEPAKSLLAFFPGHAAHLTGRHTTRGLVGISAGAVLLGLCRSTSASGPLRTSASKHSRPDVRPVIAGVRRSAHMPVAGEADQRTFRIQQLGGLAHAFF